MRHLDVWVHAHLGLDQRFCHERIWDSTWVLLLVLKFVFVFFLMQNITRNSNRARCQGGKGLSQPAPRRCSFPPIWTACMERQPSPALRRAHSTSPSAHASPGAWESSEGVVSRQEGLLRALISTGFSGFLATSSPGFLPAQVSDNMPLSVSGATTRRRRASDSESSVCRTR